MAVFGPFEFKISYIVESADVKPVVGVDIGVIALETDTNLLYLFDGTDWHIVEELRNV
jgi:hypothetical protein